MAIGSGNLWARAIYITMSMYQKTYRFYILRYCRRAGFCWRSICNSSTIFVIYRIVVITVVARDPFMTLMGAGISSLLAFQITQNIGMTIGLLPVTGVTLPF